MLVVVLVETVVEVQVLKAGLLSHLRCDKTHGFSILGVARARVFNLLEPAQGLQIVARAWPLKLVSYLG